jgi:hypothetical protein
VEAPQPNRFKAPFESQGAAKQPEAIGVTLGEGSVQKEEERKEPYETFKQPVEVNPSQLFNAQKHAGVLNQESLKLLEQSRMNQDLEPMAGSMQANSRDLWSNHSRQSRFMDEEEESIGSKRRKLDGYKASATKMVIDLGNIYGRAPETQKDPSAVDLVHQKI